MQTFVHGKFVGAIDFLGLLISISEAMREKNNGIGVGKPGF